MGFGFIGRGASVAPLKSYTTSFPATENPMSQGSIWTQGAATGVDWTNVQTTPGLAFATQTIHAHPPFDDSIACLSGHHPDQWCQGTISNTSSHSREVELILRGTITANSAILYEIDITQNAGLAIAKWSGPLNGFTVITVPGFATGVSLADGAVWYAQIVGNAILVKCNGTIVYSGTDNSIATGNPGLGFYGDFEAGSPTANNTLGWSSYSAGEL